MNERYPGGDTPPQLSEAEINLLITRVMIDGEPKIALEADLQAIDQSRANSYALEIDPFVVQMYIDEHERYSEEITSVTLEYIDARTPPRSDQLLPARLRVFIETAIRDTLAPDLVYYKDVAYTLLLQPNEEWDVIETYYDKDEVSLTAGVVESGQEKADSTRKLNQEDIAILKLLI